MLLSLLETILVMHLMAKDAAAPDEDNREKIQGQGCCTHGRFGFQHCQRGENCRWLHLEVKGPEVTSLAA